MHVPDSMRLSRCKAYELIDRHGFATLIDATLQATHLPLLLEQDEGGLGTLYGHFARANPHWQGLDGTRVLAVFSGPHAYISPSWYASRPAVPTWNYVAVHAAGTLELLDRNATRSLLDRTLARHEPELLDDPDMLDTAYFDGMLTGVVGFRIRLDTLQGKAKLGLHRPQADRDGVKAALGASQAPEARQLWHYLQALESETLKPQAEDVP
ncbi:FMN-binding negative transcriptional regulator [Billgrantia endophytica]|uniref:Transcriptional regulator n=1 Tax=Billgrantia endophytica TaxID=2033802 RepID=A0A2N7U802_9GAMM|nr:FMN-binding negative transcriptional regulator [Halomonas endophytica]PMR76557.1 transcriptional regulator [Halomonas endophytica]